MCAAAGLEVTKARAEELARQIAEAKAEVALLEQKAAKRKIERDNAEIELWELLEVLKGQNIPALIVEGAGVFRSTATIYGDIADGAEKQAEEFFLAEGLEEHMFVKKINKSYLNEYVRNLVQNGKEVPKCLVAVQKRAISIRAK